MAVVLVIGMMVTGANADTVTSTVDGNWTNGITWGGSAPGAGDDANIQHHITIDSAATDITHLYCNSGGSTKSLTMNGGSLTTTGGTAQWFGVKTLALNSGASLTVSHSLRFGTGDAEVTVDNSAFSVATANFRGSGTTDTFTITNGATFTVSGTLSGLDKDCHGIFELMGAGNTVNVGTLQGVVGASHYSSLTVKFVMDGTAAALTTFNVGTLDLTTFPGADGTTLIVDATDWNGAGNIYTLFDCTTLTGEFEDVQLIGVSPAVARVLYDTVNGKIILNTIPKGSTFMIR